MKSTSIRVTQPAWDKVCKHLLRDDGLEHLAFLLVGIRRAGDLTELLAGDVLLVDDKDLVAGARENHLEASPEAMVGAVNRAVKGGFGLVEVHNHPFTRGPVGFSPSDRMGFREVVPYMLSSLKVPLYGALVLGDKRNADGLFWEKAFSRQTTIDRVHVVGPSAATFHTSSSALGQMRAPVLSADALSRFDRQVRAFGKDGQGKLSTLSVALVGLGGIGGIAAQELGHLGVGKFVLIDHDIGEITNQNRLPGLSPEDITAKRLKVEVALRQIKTANPEAVVEVLPVKVFNREAIEALSGVDLIICGTDDSASRYAVNEIALAYLRPYLDVATGILTEHGKLDGVGGRYTFTFPGTGCLLCAGAIDPAEATKEFTPVEVRKAQARDGYIQGSSEPAASVMPLNGLVTSQAVFEVFAWVTGFRAPFQQRLFDQLQGTIDRVTFNANPRCVPCRENMGRGDLAELQQKYSRWASEQPKVDVKTKPRGLVGRILSHLGFLKK